MNLLAPSMVYIENFSKRFCKKYLKKSKIFQWHCYPRWLTKNGKNLLAPSMVYFENVSKMIYEKSLRIPRIRIKSYNYKIYTLCINSYSQSYVEGSKNSKNFLESNFYMFLNLQNLSLCQSALKIRIFQQTTFSATKAMLCY